MNEQNEIQGDAREECEGCETGLPESNGYHFDPEMHTILTDCERERIDAFENAPEEKHPTLQEMDEMHEALNEAYPE